MHAESSSSQAPDISRASERVILLEGAFNARDAGGLPTVDGREVRRNVLLRMDSPQRLTEKDAEVLLDEHGVRTILDLRYTDESREHGIGPLRRDDVVHINVPVRSSDSMVAPGLRAAVDAAPERPVWEITYEYYKGYFQTNDGAALVSALRELIRPDATPVLVHCAAGKDRTGVVVALAQSLAGVNNDIIAADYAASASAVPKIVARLAELGGYGELDPQDISRQMTSAETMLALMDWVDKEYGGAREFLHLRGLSETELDRLSAVLVTEGN